MAILEVVSNTIVALMRAFLTPLLPLLFQALIRVRNRETRMCMPVCCEEGSQDDNCSELLKDN